MASARASLGESRMKSTRVVVALLLAAGCARAQLVPDAPIDCTQCAGWNVRQEPFRIYGNTYYVGTTELSSILISTGDGLILIDGALPQTAPLIDASIRALGFDTKDVRLILGPHTHYDHAGGIAALQRASGATVAASPKSAEALRSGRPTPDDPQFAVPNNGFPALSSVRVIGDGETLTVGGLGITAHFTPGHTPGGTTWTWSACDRDKCLRAVYADSLNAVSADGFRFTGDRSHPSIVESFRQSLRTVEQ